MVLRMLEVLAPETVGAGTEVLAFVVGELLELCCLVEGNSAAGDVALAFAWSPELTRTMPIDLSTTGVARACRGRSFLLLHYLLVRHLARHCWSGLMLLGGNIHT